MDQQNIDRLFREKLDHLEVTPTANAWSQVEKQIRQKKTPVIYWVAASVSLLLISWIVWPSFQNQAFTPIAGEVSHPVYQGAPEFVVPVLEQNNKKEEKAKPVQVQRDVIPPTQFAKNKASKEQEIMEELPLVEVDSKTTVAEAEIEKPLIIDEVIEQLNKPEFRAVKITYIASAGNNSSTQVQKSDSTGALKKFIAFAEKIDPGDVLADIKTAKDNLLNGGFKNKKDKNSL
ncbi:hypothetical protein [Ekhidna sp.]|uniref:hypothetical protein n=1 Tax=Ekhidna sp. TaxID=2608089 RepID=UPI003BABB2B9